MSQCKKGKCLAIFIHNINKIEHGRLKPQYYTWNFNDKNTLKFQKNPTLLLGKNDNKLFNVIHKKAASPDMIYG